MRNPLVRERKALLPMMPRTAQDLDAAMQIVQLGYPAVAPLLGDMIQAMRVAESPVADAFAAFFAQLGRPGVDAIDRGLSRENCWLRHRVLYQVLPQWSPELLRELSSTLSMIATQPDAYDNDIVAMSLLGRHGLADSGWLKDWAAFKRERWTVRNQLLTQLEQDLDAR